MFGFGFILGVVVTLGLQFGWPFLKAFLSKKVS